MNMDLLRQFTTEEVKTTIFHIDPTKAPRIDSFLTHFINITRMLSVITLLALSLIF